jgi:hypothetical protein
MVDELDDGAGCDVLARKVMMLRRISRRNREEEREVTNHAESIRLGPGKALSDV